MWRAEAASRKAARLRRDCATGEREMLTMLTAHRSALARPLATLAWCGVGASHTGQWLVVGRRGPAGQGAGNGAVEAALISPVQDFPSSMEVVMADLRSDCCGRR